MKKVDDKKEKYSSSTQPSPDNRGVEQEDPKHVDEAAAVANRDIGKLLEMYPKAKQNKGKKGGIQRNK